MTTQELTSLGCASQLLQCSTGQILAAAESLGIAPAEIHNGVAQFDSLQIEWIRAELRGDDDA